ncbi:MAG: MYXO-CTERM sorting domain-containing protein [Deltaproteobacteria bacterium]|nr:MYXO-CTERM sorting domain-containing protein [Deltaproteobacteria bacterium]
MIVRIWMNVAISTIACAVTSDDDDDDDGCGCSVTGGKASGFALPALMLMIGVFAYVLGLRRSR